MSAWSELLPRLTEQPRENGSAALHETAAWLAETLQRTGLDVSTVAYTAHPYRLRLAGVLALFGGALYAWSLRARRPLLALCVAVAMPALLLVELDRYVPIVSWIRPAPQATQRLILSAHYDTKTDLLDHVERAPIELLGLPVTALMIVAAAWSARRRYRRGPLPRVARIAVWVAPLYGFGLFASLSAGMLVRARSPGALDDGAACAVLVRLAERLHAAGPLPHTEVEVALLSGEEIGVEGSWEYARQRFSAPPELPTSVINLEFIGAAPDLAVFGSEKFSLRSFPPDPTLVGILDAVHRQQRQKPLYVTWDGAATDARSYLAHGIPAATLSSDLPGHALGRGMHAASDSPDRVDPAALDATLAYLEAAVRAADQRGLR